MKKTEKMLKSSNLKSNLNEKINQNPSVAIYKKERGITLIALVVTIVVLIILATVSINAVMGENGIIRRAEIARQHQANAEARDNAAMDELAGYLANAMAGEGNSGGTQTPTDPDEPVATGPNGKPLTSTVTDPEHEGTDTEDTLGNPVHIPGGFIVPEDSGETVREGIVIEDENGNQFVWIPVSNINHDGSNKIKVDANTEVEITLGRYTFDIGTKDSTTKLYNGTGAVSTTAGTYQYAVNYATPVTLETYYQELTTKIEGKNEVAKDLQDFVESVRDNHGYYLARYEASYASGSTFGVGNDETYYKPASKISTNVPTAEDSSTEGYLWTSITQGNASKASQNMYYGNSYVESDLVNSYAWDTAIVYIQAMTNSNYACANNYSTGNTSSILNTGETGDQKCKIFDMAANISEYTTEYFSYDDPDEYGLSPYTYRGGNYRSSGNYTAYRYDDVGHIYDFVGFRVQLYISNPES